MSLEDEQEINLKQLRQKAYEADKNLLIYVESLCPKPHVVKQHRDGRIPWCERCGRTVRGIKIKEV